MQPKCKNLLCVSIGILFVIIPCGGCGDQMRGSELYGATITGAIIGGIVGHQSDETEAGVAIGAALFCVGDLLGQMDRQADSQSNERKIKEENIKETYVIEIHNSNGSITPVTIRKKDNIYIGPKKEQYKELPTEEQLRPLYGL